MLRSYTAANFGSIERRERSDGSGDVIFAYQPYTYYDSSHNTATNQYSNGVQRTGTRTIGFFGIRDVRTVEQLIRMTFVPTRT